MMYLEKLFGLKGKVAVVTGGGQGIGQTVALGLAQAGADLVIVCRHGADETIRKIEEVGGSQRIGYSVRDRASRYVVDTVYMPEIAALHAEFLQHRYDFRALIAAEARREVQEHENFLCHAGRRFDRSPELQCLGQA